MWSNTIFNQYSTFQGQYALELLHSCDSHFDKYYFENENLRNKMIDLANRDDHCFYQLALHAYQYLQQNNPSFDLLTVFNDDMFSKMQESLQTNDKSYLVATVYVTPSTTRVMPLEITQGHRALRHKAFNGPEDFCLVYLKPDSSDKYVNKCLRYKHIFENGISICNNQYYLFGLSNSQLREHSYWFIRATSSEEIHHKRQLLGDFSKINNIGKYVARLGLWFSKSNPTGITLEYIADFEEFNHRVEQGDVCVTKMDDIERNDYNFTDGCGLISKGLAKLVAEKLGYLFKHEENDFYPSAYQIRVAGCKGLVILDPQSTFEQFYVKIRSSMKKFESIHWDLEICDVSQPIPTRLNNQIIILMSDLGIHDSIFLQLQDKWFEDKTQFPISKLNLLKNKIPLPVNECRYIFGCALESRLKEGQCFIRYQVLNDKEESSEKPKFKTVLGPVIVTKNPCPYAGDIRILEGIDLPELHCIQDVLVFSIEGNRPDCNKIAGSDLDGDQYFVYWGAELQFHEIIEPLAYQPQQVIITSRSITHEDFINYCYSSLGATSYGEIYNLHAIIVDQNKENHSRRTCQKLAIKMSEMFSAAIDSGKTGYIIDREQIRQIRKLTGSKYPDFLMKKNSYSSESILGILYRKALEFIEKNPSLFDDEDLDNPSNCFSKVSERNFRFYVKVRLALHIPILTIHNELQTIFGEKAPSDLQIQQWYLYYQAKSQDSQSTPLE